MWTYQYIALVIHDLNDLIKLTDCCHDLIIISGFWISIKCSGCVLDQCMKKYMCDFFKRIFNQWFFRNLAFCSKIHVIFIFCKIILLFQQFDCLIIIILLIHDRCLIKHRIRSFCVCRFFWILCICINVLYHFRSYAVCNRQITTSPCQCCCSKYCCKY